MQKVGEEIKNLCFQLRGGINRRCPRDGERNGIAGTAKRDRRIHCRRRSSMGRRHGGKVKDGSGSVGGGDSCS